MALPEAPRPGVARHANQVVAALRAFVSRNAVISRAHTADSGAFALRITGFLSSAASRSILLNISMHDYRAGHRHPRSRRGPVGRADRGVGSGAVGLVAANARIRPSLLF